MRKLLLHTLIFFGFLSAGVTAQDYLWPTDASKLLTSSYCEFRPRHYHAAVDIKTWSKTGYKIFAIEDGFVYRLRVAATGYGKAIYLRLKDGNYVVYGHLDSFNDALKNYADSLRLASRSNILDDYPKAERFPVSKGDFLGYTGETGIGVPHLHFEIRNANQHPINPLRFYLSDIVDTIAPRSRYLAVIPQSSATLINFRPDTLLLPVQQINRTRLSEPVYLTGKAFLALRSFDLANGADNGFDFYEAEMLINDSTVYRIAYNRFSYNESRLIELDKNFSLQRKGFRVYHNFYRHPANTLPFYIDTPKGSGLLSSKSLKPGKNDILFRVKDFHGNTNEVGLTIYYHDREEAELYNTVQLDDGFLVAFKSKHVFDNFAVSKVDVHGKKIREYKNPRLEFNKKVLGDNFYHLIIPERAGSRQTYYQIIPFMENGAPVLPIPIFTDSSDFEQRLKTVTPIISPKFFGNDVMVRSNIPLPLLSGQNRSSFRYTPYEYVTPMSLSEFERIRAQYPSPAPLARSAEQWKLVTPGGQRVIESSDQMVTLQYTTNSVYDSMHVAIFTRKPGERIPRLYQYASQAYVAEPFDEPLNIGATLYFRLPGEIARQNGIGLYYLDRNKKEWQFLPAKFDGNSTYSAKVLSLETFVAIRDTVPPEVRPINLQRFNEDPSAHSRLTFSVRDEMSGIYRETQIQVSISGNWSLFEYDPEEKLVTLYREHLPRGKHVIRLSATDNAGNRSTETYNVSY